MIDFKHLQGNLTITITGIILSGLGKTILKKEFIPVSSGKQILESSLFLMVVTILGKKSMDLAVQNKIVNFQVHKKNPNEGFIGPLKNEKFGPTIFPK